MKPSDMPPPYHDDGVAITAPPRGSSKQPMCNVKSCYAASAAHHAANEARYEEDHHEVTGHSLFPSGSKTGAGYHSKGGYSKPMHLHLKKGALHKQMGVASGHKIPHERLEKAAHSSNPKLRKRAQFALNAAKWKH